MRVAGLYPSQFLAGRMVALQAAPGDFTWPERWGHDTLIYRVERRDDEWAVVGRTLQELRDLDG